MIYERGFGPSRVGARLNPRVPAASMTQMAKQGELPSIV